MKRYLLFILIAAIVFNIAACGGETQIDNSTQQQSDMSIEEESQISVDKNLISVDITIPASWYEGEDMENFDTESYVAENGYKDAKINDDGSVTITMSKKKHEEIIKSMQEEIQSDFDELITSEDAPYIKAITTKNNYQEVIVEVDKIGYESAFLDMTPFLIGYTVIFYQVMAGDAQHCEVIIQDSETKEIILSTIYPDAFNQ